ncbi:MAG TPA: hypothetical protein VK255_01205 [Patescibacteria group bacterium]|nr:hypothetical protein [Patescibacteria group bacterium]
MEIINEAEKMFDIEGCAVVSRRGAIRRHAGTLMHLHSHIMVVRLDKDGLPVGVLRAYFAKSRKELEHCKKVVELFERVRTGNITGVRRGYIVCDTEGQYLNPNKEWEKCDIPINATLLNIPLDQIKVMTGKNIRYYEAMTSTETGTVLIDGPFELI